MKAVDVFPKWFHDDYAYEATLRIAWLKRGHTIGGYPFRVEWNGSGKFGRPNAIVKRDSEYPLVDCNGGWFLRLGPLILQWSVRDERGYWLAMHEARVGSQLREHEG